MPDSLHNMPHTSAPVSLPAAEPPFHRSSLTDDQDAELLERAQAAVAERHTPATPRQPRPAATVLRHDSIPADSVAPDSVATHHRQGVILVAAPKVTTAPAAPRHTQGSDVTSWIILGLLTLFLLVTARMRRNFKYLKILAGETVSARSRQNMFADTMRERAFSVLLNVLCVVSAGVLLAQGAAAARGMAPAPSGAMPPGLWGCLCISTGYYAAQWIAYLLIGHIFATRVSAHLWLQGFNACTALPGLIFFPLVLLGIFEPGAQHVTLYVAGGVYIAARLLFIFKGVRIFCTGRTYYIIFLYYLCSVEIVPLLLVWHLALTAV